VALRHRNGPRLSRALFAIWFAVSEAMMWPGVSPIAWSDDLPAMGGAAPLEACLAEVPEAGFTGIEVGHKFPPEAQTLRPVLERHGLALIQFPWRARPD
jgi:hypothetical protein